MCKKIEQRWSTIRDFLDAMMMNYKKIEEQETQQVDWQKQVFKCLVEEYVSLLSRITGEPNDEEVILQESKK